MRAVVLEVTPLPGQTVRARRRPIRPEVRPPHDQWRGLLNVVERSRTWIAWRSAHLVDLRLDRPLHREAALVGVRLRIQIRSRVPTIDATGQENHAQVR